MLFVSTDASKEEFEELKFYAKDISKVVRYEPTENELDQFLDGGVAIIDQSICSHARYFIGTSESTFTFRIQEEKEIMGFKLDDTFDMLCRDGQETCEGGTRWKIEWDKRGHVWEQPSRSRKLIVKSEL